MRSLLGVHYWPSPAIRLVWAKMAGTDPKRPLTKRLVFKSTCGRKATRMKERLQNYALIGEIIGAVAIVISLVFVGLQLQQSNRLAAAESLREGTIVWQEAYVKNFGSEESAAFMRQALNDYRSLNNDQKGRFYATFFSFVAAFDTLHNQYEAGLLRQETYISIARWYYAVVRMPGVLQMFEENDMYLAPYLVDPSSNDAFVRSGVKLAPLPFFQE